MLSESCECDVISYDPRGIGESTQVLGSGNLDSISMSTLTDDALIVLNHVRGQGPPVGVLGVSMGAAIAVHAANCQSESISHLILASSLLNAPKREFLNSSVEEFFRIAFGAEFKNTSRFVKKYSESKQSNMKGILAQRRILKKHHMPESIPSEIKLMVLHGSHDSVAPLENGVELASKYGVDPVVVEGAGHLPWITHSEELVSRVSSFY